MSSPSFRSCRVISCAIVLCLAAALPLRANTPPDAPTIVEPHDDGQLVSGEDLHMAIAAFHDADPGDQHFCTDWEIATRADKAAVWSALCLQDPSTRVHAHLGDGQFTGAATGMRSLPFDTEFTLRLRVRDNSGDPSTEWSAWSERWFRTSPESVTLPLTLDDIASDPPPEWRDATSQPVVLGDTSLLQLEQASGDMLLEIAANRTTNPPPLAQHGPVRLVVQGGTGGLTIAESDLGVFDESARPITIALPAIHLSAGESVHYWISENGSTYLDEPPSATPQFEVLARGAAVPWSAPSDYRVEIFARGFRLPVNIAFVPQPHPEAAAPFFYVTELYGGIKVVTRDGSVDDYATGLLNFDPTAPFPGPGERGVTGLAADPATGDLFASMMAAAPDESFEPRIVRLTSTDGGMHASSVSVVLAMPGTPQASSHQISNISVGPDGDLYVHIADAMRWWYSQNLDSFLGKIIRLHPDGSPASTNPFYDATDGITAKDYIYALGLRNPFGGAWRAADQSLYCVENGPDVDRLSRIASGRNYLWDNTDLSMFTFALYNWWPAAAPVGIAFVQDETFGRSGFPESMRDHAFVTESGPTWAKGKPLTGKRIREFTFDAQGRIASDVPFVEYTGDGHASVSGIAAGPDGLYFADLYSDAPNAGPTDRGSNILRLRFVGGAHFTCSADPADPLSASFQETATLPHVTSWQWSFGDGGTSAEKAPTHRYDSTGVYPVRLRVTTTEGDTSVVATMTYLGAHNGTGLEGRYFADRAMTLPLATRTEPVIDFDWRTKPPEGVMSGSFAVRWSGYVEPRFSQTYTFSTAAAGDVRLWIGDRLVIDDWIGHPRGIDSALVPLVAGRRYEVTFEFATVESPPEVHLYWSSESQPKEIVPADSLYPAPRSRAVTRSP